MLGMEFEALKLSLNGSSANQSEAVKLKGSVFNVNMNMKCYF